MIARSKSRLEIERDLILLTYDAARCVPVVGTAQHPTAWDQLHARIDATLDCWQRAH